MDTPKSIARRDFLRLGALAGAGMVLAPSITRAQSKGDTINVAIIGTGVQGRVLLEAALNIPQIRFVAVCDIWEYSQRYGSGILRKNGHTVNVYEDYREMLDKEKNIDAVIVATPDFWHSPITVDCLEAGKHVYCEKMMSNTVEGARKMVQAQKRTGKLLQIGHQRRSNPRYQYVKEQVIDKVGLFGRITNVNGQWNRSVNEDETWPEKFAIPEDKLKKWGFKSMHAFRNWRWYRDYGGGPMSDLGAHQIDIYHWFLGNRPKSVMASGGADFYPTREWYDNVMSIYEFDTEAGPVRAFYQVLTTTSAGGGYWEYFMGTEGAIKMSENPNLTQIFRENNAPEWTQWQERGLVKREGGAAKPAATVDVRETAALSTWQIPVELNKPIHQPHIENFVAAVMKGEKLNCPAEEAFVTEVTVLKAHEAIEAGRKLEFTEEDFKV